MPDRTNTIFGWLLFCGIVGMGLYSLSSHYFGAGKHEGPEAGGYPVEVESADGGEDSGPSLNTLLATGDAAKGEKLFAKCASCHTINQGGANGIGPNLYGIVGEAIAQGRGGFAFSDALKNHGGNWTFENLDAWLKSPKAFAEGTAMSFAGMSKAEDRANLILYLNAQGSNLPIPAADPEGEAGAKPAEGGAEDAAIKDASTEATDEAKGGDTAEQQAAPGA